MNALEEVTYVVAAASPDPVVVTTSPWTQAAVIASIAALFGFIAWFFHKPKKGYLKMGKDTVVVSDIITAAFDQAVVDKKWSGKNRDYWTKRIADRANIPDLKSRWRIGHKLSLRAITRKKEQIKWRLDKWMHVINVKDAKGEVVSTTTRKFYDGGAHTNIPGPLPGDELRALVLRKEESGVRRQKFASGLKAA